MFVLLKRAQVNHYPYTPRSTPKTHHHQGTQHQVFAVFLHTIASSQLALRQAKSSRYIQLSLCIYIHIYAQSYSSHCICYFFAQQSIGVNGTENKNRRTLFFRWLYNLFATNISHQHRSFVSCGFLRVAHRLLVYPDGPRSTRGDERLRHRVLVEHGRYDERRTSVRLSFVRVCLFAIDSQSVSLCACLFVCSLLHFRAIHRRRQ